MILLVKREYLVVCEKFKGILCGQNTRWEVVDAVARTGSFSSAAQELHRVPPMMSYTVRQSGRMACRSFV